MLTSTVSNFDLEQLIRGLKQRDHKILTEIYKQYFPMVLGYIVAHGGGDSDAKDIFQDSILVIYKLLDENKLEVKTDFGTFIIGIAKKMWLNQIRKEGIHQRYVEQADCDELEDHPFEKEIEGETELNLIRKYIIKLGEDCRKVLMWSAEGKTNDEIAKKLSYKSEKIVRTKKYRCKEYLIKLIKGDPEYQQ